MAEAVEEGQLGNLVRSYVKIRDERAEVKRDFDEKDKQLLEQLDTIKVVLLAHCADQGVESVRTVNGTFYRTTRTTYWTSDWEEFYKVVIEQAVPELLEKRIAQRNLKEFMKDNPDVIPKGLQAKSEYTISVRKDNGYR
jgi:hypothetical protein